MLAPGDDVTVVRQQNGLLVPQRGTDDLAFFVADRDAGPVGQEGAIVVQRCDVHLRYLQRNFQHRQRGDMEGWVCTMHCTSGRAR